MLIALNDMIDSVTLRFKNVTIESKTVRSGARRWNSSSESVSGNFFVRVIILQDFSNSFDSLYILITFWIFTMKRIPCFGVTIRQSKVDSNIQIDLASPENILHKIG